MLAFGGVDARAQPIPVFIQAANQPPTAKPRDLEAAAAAAEARVRSIRDAVYKEHGSKRAVWSAQTADAVDTAENAAPPARPSTSTRATRRAKVSTAWSRTSFVK